MRGIKETRKNLGYSRKFIIDNLGITLAKLSLIENGKSVPMSDTKRKIESVIWE